MEDGADEGEAFDPVKQARLMTHLQDKLPAFEFTSVPLGQFVAFLSVFSTVPMVIDAQSLVEAGKSAKMRITVKLDDATVEEALKAALDKPGLAFHIEPGRLVITPREIAVVRAALVCPRVPTSRPRSRDSVLVELFD